MTTDRWGVDDSYVDASGVRRRIAPDVVDRLRALIGEPVAPDAAALVVRAGEAPVVSAGVLVLEDGGKVEVEDRLPADLPLGYHELHLAAGVRSVIVAPRRCVLPTRRGWGWAAQLYATRSRESWGMGDLGDLRRLARWSRRLDAEFVLVNPLHATAPTAAQQPSPYSPATRRFLNPIYLRIEDVPGADELGAALEPLAAAGRRLNADRQIDRDEVWRLKRAALEQVWAGQRQRPEFLAWYAQETAVARYAVWCALADRHGPDWRRWPSDYRHPEGPRVAEFGARNADLVRFFGWLQWLTRRQLAESAAEIALIQDLPIGVDPGGVDAWMWQDLLATGVTVGAPPDEFNRRGQDWGLPPFIPHKLAEAGYRPFTDAIRATLVHHGGLRIDHVMGLFRLWWIPEGAEAADGAYVRYPADDLLGIVALESHRADAVVIGEDLGTVEPGVRETLAEHNVLSYQLLWFSADRPSTWPEKSLGAITTHDLPTVAGLWDGSDLDEQQRLGLDPNDEATAEIARRLAAMGGVEVGAPAEQAVLAAHRLLASSPSLLVSATLDDALGEPRRPNMPGAADRAANWALALSAPLEVLETLPAVRRLAGVLAGATGATGATGPALPEARGPLSATILRSLVDPARGDRRDWCPEDADPFGEDLQLALYACYELHYRGLAGVAEEREWDPVVLGLRADLERCFLAALRAAVPAGDDPWAAVEALLGPSGEGGVSAHLARAGELAQVRELVVHRSLYHLKEADPQAWVIPRLTGRVKAALVAVEFDEYGAGRAERAHARLFADLMGELGLVAEYGRYLDLVPAPMLATVNFMSMCGLHRRLRAALVGQFAAVEITSPPGSARMVTALERLGVGPAGQTFYAEHVVADAVHEQVMRRDVLADLLAQEPYLAADVAFGIAAGTWLDDRLDAHLLDAWARGATSLRGPLPG